MSFAGLAMDLLLMVLLVCAIAFGVRLDRKLKALRQGQEDFGRAVVELDNAARRAEAGLASLRQATDEAHDSLHDRILKARELKTQLESLIARAERMPAERPAPERPVLDRIAAAPVRAAAPERPAFTRPEPAPVRTAPRRFDEDLFESAGDRR